MMAQQVPHQSIDRKRVKVYELRNNDWFDRGTGYCSSAYTTTDDNEVREPRIVVESEDSPDRLLLDTRIHHDDGFQRQQDTLIVWTEPTTGLDMALSFQEAEGCLLIWNFISDVQQSISAPMGEDAMSDEVPVDIPATITLPPAELANLENIETNMRIMSTTAGGRDALSRCIISDEYIHKLIPLVEIAEKQENLADLHHLCNIVKIILLMNDTTIIEYALSDGCFMGVVGALEYDPDFPSHKANHREWLNKGRFKEVVPIGEEKIQLKIHQTYRLQYLKDVVLARILDDPTFSVLNSLIFFNQVDILQHLQSSPTFLPELFGIFSDPNQKITRKKQAVFFIQQCCAIIKNLQPTARMSLYTNFLNHGLLNVINFGLRNPDVTVRIGATDILVSMIDHDPHMVRQTIYRQVTDKSVRVQLTDTLIDLLHVEVDLGIKSQICDVLKVLFDPIVIQITTTEPAANGNGKETQQVTRRQTDPLQEVYMSHFYENGVKRLFKPLTDLKGQAEPKFSVLDEGVFTYLHDIIIYFARAHTHLHRCKFFIMEYEIIARFGQLLSCPVKHLQLTALRFLRQLMATRDNFYTQTIFDNHLIDRIFDLLERCLPRDNLVGSACLDFFDFFVKEDVVEHTEKLVMGYKDHIEKLSYLPTFNDLLTGRYPQLLPQHPQHQAVLGSNGHLVSQPQQLGSSTEEDGDLGAASLRIPNGAHTSSLDSIGMDPEEEAYWNNEDDDDELHNSLGSPDDEHTNGDSSVLKQLVDYPSDEDADESASGGGSSDPIEPEADGATPANDAKETAPTAAATENGSQNGAGADADDAETNGNSDSENIEPGAVKSVGTAAPPPPERVSEKRRREEDEEDDLTKMMLQNNKRRNSRSNSLNSNTSVLAKMSTGVNGTEVNVNGNGDASAPKKISINITATPTVQALATEATGPGSGDE